MEGEARTVRIVVTLKPGVLDAPGQAIRQGLDALGHPGVRCVQLLVVTCLQRSSQVAAKPCSRLQPS